MFRYKNKLVFPVYISDQTFKTSIDLLLLIDDDKSHYVYIKDFNTFMFHKTKNKNKKWLCKSCLQCFSSENVLIKHRKDCLSISGQQSINLEKETIEFNSCQFHLKFMLVLIVTLEMFNVIKVLTQKNIMSMFLVVMLTKLFVLIIDLVSQLLFIDVKMLLINLLKQHLKNVSIVKK